MRDVAPRAGAWNETAACGANDWKIYPDIKQLQKKIEISVNTYTGTAEEYWEAHKTVIDGKEYLVLEDYHGRKWRMDRESFNTHTTNNRRKKRAARVNYLNEIQNTAMNPDEVWLHRTDESFFNNVKTLDNYVFIKYYNDITLAVAGKIKDDNFIFTTWFPVMSDNVRKGILLDTRQWVRVKQ